MSITSQPVERRPLISSAASSGPDRRPSRATADQARGFLGERLADHPADVVRTEDAAIDARRTGRLGRGLGAGLALVSADLGRLHRRHQRVGGFLRGGLELVEQAAGRHGRGTRGLAGQAGVHHRQQAREQDH
jgi:hypothetical protein